MVSRKADEAAGLATGSVRVRPFLWAGPWPSIVRVRGVVRRHGTVFRPGSSVPSRMGTHRPSQPEGMASPPPPRVPSDSRNGRAARRALAFSRWVALLDHCGRPPPFPARVVMTRFGPLQAFHRSSVPSLGMSLPAVVTLADHRRVFNPANVRMLTVIIVSFQGFV